MQLLTSWQDEDHYKREIWEEKSYAHIRCQEYTNTDQ